MQMIRNPEIKKMMAAYSIFTGIACVVGLILFSTIKNREVSFLWYNAVTLVYIALVCAAAIVLFLFITKQRYNDLSDLSYEIDKILHANEKAYLVPNKEGELALLTNQIAKMTIRLQEQTEQLQAEKNRLSSSIADISHQIRTPLTSVRMVLHRLMSDELTKEQRNDHFHEINGMLSRVEWLITALLKIARLESGAVVLDKAEIDVYKLIKEVLEPLEIMMELKGIHADIQIQDNAVFQGDFSWSNEAVCNIIKNCIEHTPEGGQLKIRALENALYTQIVITDSGTGVPAEDLPHLFERFYKGKNSDVQNVGIGLNLSRMIIHRENGTVKVRNVKPHGTEFELRFYKGAI